VNKTLILVIIAYVSGYIYNSRQDTPFEAIDRFGNVVWVIHPKHNTYFCPLYCAIDHIHSGHNNEFICNRDTICSHYFYKNLKKDKTWQSKIKE